MDTSLTASVATFRVFSSSSKVGARPHDAQMTPPNAQDRMAATPVTEGPLLLSKLASNEVTYLQVNDFTRAIMARSRIWRVAPRELVIPASFSTYWLVTLHGSSRAVARLDKTLKPLCKYEVVFDVSQLEEESEEDTSVESDAPVGHDDSSLLTELSPQHSARVLHARQIISRGKMSQMLNDVNESQTPWSDGSAPRRRVRSEPGLNTPPVTPPSSGSDKARPIGPPSPVISLEVRDLAVSEGPSAFSTTAVIHRPLEPGTPLTLDKLASSHQQDASKPQPEVSARLESTPLKNIQATPASAGPSQEPEVSQSILRAQDAGQPVRPAQAAGQIRPTHDVGQPIRPVKEATDSQSRSSPHQATQSKSIPAQEAAVPHSRLDLPQEGLQARPNQETGSQSKPGSPSPEPDSESSASETLMDKFAPRFSHPLIPPSHITQFYPRTSSISTRGPRPPASLPKRDLTLIGPSNLHQEVTTVGGYIGLRAVRGLLRKT